MERRRTFVHQHVQQAQRQEHDLRFVRKDALPNLEGRRLPEVGSLVDFSHNLYVGVHVWLAEVVRRGFVHHVCDLLTKCHF